MLEFITKKAFEEVKNKLKPKITFNYLVLRELNVIPNEVIWVIMKNLFFNTYEYSTFEPLITKDVKNINWINFATMGLKTGKNEYLDELYDKVLNLSIHHQLDKFNFIFENESFILPDDYYDYIIEKFNTSNLIDIYKTKISHVKHKLTYNHLIN